MNRNWNFLRTFVRRSSVGSESAVPITPFAPVRNANAAPVTPFAPVKKQKHKIPQKRASFLKNVLVKEEFEKLKAGRQWPSIRAGDSVVIEKVPNISSKEVETIKGLVIGITKKASDTSMQLMNVEHGTPIYRRITMYSPFIKDIRIIQKAALYKGKKRVRKAKLYNLLDRHPDVYTVK